MAGVVPVKGLKKKGGWKNARYKNILGCELIVQKKIEMKPKMVTNWLFGSFSDYIA